MSNSGPSASLEIARLRAYGAFALMAPLTWPFWLFLAGAHDVETDRSESARAERRLAVAARRPATVVELAAWRRLRGCKRTAVPQGMLREQR
jgi:hypothetical protein